MREWSPEAQSAMLKWLRDVAHEQPNPTTEIELWRVRKGERELRCVAVYIATGIDLRLFEGADFRPRSLSETRLSAPLSPRYGSTSCWSRNGWTAIFQ